MKITNEQIEQYEIESMIDALGNCLELNAEFINQYCGENVAKLLLSVPESDREYVLNGCIEGGNFPGGLYGEQLDAIVLPSGEIEVQFKGAAEDYFETPDELTINGDIAYLYTGYGLILPVNCEKLAANIAELNLPVA